MASALGTCASRYLRRVLASSPAAVVVVVGATARGVFEAQFQAPFTGDVQHPARGAWVWRRGEMFGRTRCVLALPHPNARVSAHDVAGNIGPQLTTELRDFLRAWTPQAATGRTPGAPPPRGAQPMPPLVRHSPPASADHRAAGDPRPTRPTQLFGVTTRKRDRTGDLTLMPGRNYVIVGVNTPWKPGAIRIIHVTGTDPDWRTGEIVNLINASTGLRLGQYEVVAGHSGKATIWDLP